MIVSNSAGTKDDPNGVEAAATEQALKVSVLRHVEKKPSYGCGSELIAALDNPKPETVAMIGDRVRLYWSRMLCCMKKVKR